jgi:hypothetical protein
MKKLRQELHQRRMNNAGRKMAATKWRKKVAHGASRGLSVLLGTSSVGAAENTASSAGNFLSPFQGFAGSFQLPTVCTVGYLSIAAPQQNL